MSTPHRWLLLAVPLALCPVSSPRWALLASAHAAGVNAPRLTQPPLTEDEKIVHVLNRLAFGPRPGDVAAVREMGLDQWMEQQLHPEQIDDSAVDQAVAQLKAVQLPSADLMAAYREDRIKKAKKQAGAIYPPGKLGQSLQQIARLIKENVGLELAFTDVGGWDTHVNQGGADGNLANHLRDLGKALAAFYTDLGDRAGDVVLLTMSEFGRTAHQNGNAGTDHGHGTCFLAMGGPVNGGKVLGQWPGLAPEQLYQHRDLAVTTDFRDVFAEVANRHLGVQNLPAVFPNFAPSADRFRGVIRA